MGSHPVAVVQYTCTHKQYRERHRTNNSQNDTKIHRTTHKTHRTTQQLGRVWAVPGLCGFYPGICFTTEEKAQKNLSQDSINHRTPDPNNSKHFMHAERMNIKLHRMQFFLTTCSHSRSRHVYGTRNPKCVLSGPPFFPVFSHQISVLIPTSPLIMVTYHRHSQTVPSEQYLCVFLISLLCCRRTENVIGLHLVTKFKSVEQNNL